MEREEIREWECGRENWEERKSEGKRRFKSAYHEKEWKSAKLILFPLATKTIYIYRA